MGIYMKFNRWIVILSICVGLLLTGCGSESQITQLDDKYASVLEKDASETAQPTAGENVDADEGKEADGSVTNQSGDSAAQNFKENLKEDSGNSEKDEKRANPTASTSVSSQSATKSISKPAKTQKTTKSKTVASKKNSASKSKKTTSANAKKNSDKSESNTKTDSESSNTVAQKEAEDTVQSAEGTKETTAPAATKTPAEKTCTIAIDCKTILANKKKLNSAKESFVPTDGIILKKTTVTIKAKDTVYDILYRICKSNNIHLESDYTPAYKTYYVKGIHQLYEMDCGDLSGWSYKVNGVTPNYGASKYTVKDGDNIEWRFSCNAGKDVE